MESDLFCDDYYAPPSAEAKAFIETIIQWRYHNQVLYPSDVINIAIQSGLLNVDQCNNLISTSKKHVDLQLPIKYIDL